MMLLNILLKKLKMTKKLKPMKQKGVYPYDYIYSLNRFNENKITN